MAVAVVLVTWLMSASGRGALRTCLAHPFLVAPALMVLVVDIATDHLPRDLSQPFISESLPGLALRISIPLLAMAAAHILASAWVISMLSDIVLGVRPQFGAVLGRTAGFLAVIWVGLFASFIPMASIPRDGMIVGLMAWGLALYWLNCRLAAATAAIPLSCERGGLFGLMRRLYLGRAGAFRWTVLVHFLCIGALTLVWLEGYRTVDEGRTTVLSAFNWKVNAQCVLNVTLGNGWPGAIADAVREEVPSVLNYLLRGLTALLSTLFIAAYMRLGRDSESSPLRS